MKCSDIMNRNIELLFDGDSVERAATVMAEAQVGFLPVCGGDRNVLGVVTDRDLVTRVMAKGLDVKATAVRDVMSSPALTCFVDADLRLAEDLIRQEAKMRVVLVHQNGTVAGVLSIADIAENAPTREAMRTLRSVLWGDALGPRGGAGPDEPLLQDEPIPPPLPEADRPHRDDTIFARGRRETDTKEFPG
jgi:CBS domain-containing protein